MMDPVFLIRALLPVVVALFGMGAIVCVALCGIGAIVRIALRPVAL